MNVFKKASWGFLKQPTVFINGFAVPASVSEKSINVFAVSINVSEKSINVFTGSVNVSEKSVNVFAGSVNVSDNLINTSEKFSNTFKTSENSFN